MGPDPNLPETGRMERMGHATGAALLYSVSLPERLLRALTASIGGALKETTDVLIPTALKHSTFYRIFIDNLLRYALEYVGKVEGVYPTDGDENEETVVGKDYPARKTVGNVLEAISIGAIHLSPLWIFAIGSDLLKGGRAYVEELQRELVDRGLVKGDLEPGNTYQLLASLEATSDALAANVDTPPLSRSDLKNHAEELKEALNEVRQALAGSKDKLQETFDDFKSMADEAGNRLELAGVMTIRAAQQVPLKTKQLATGAEVAATMVVDQLLLYYPRTLAEIHSRGYAKVASEALAPYGRAVVANFDASNPTLTERFFTGAGHKLKDLLTGRGRFSRERPTDEGSDME